MSARVLTAYLATAALMVGFFTQAAAKPPDLPAKLEIECDQPAAAMVVKVYQVADLVIPIDNAPVSGAVPAPAPYLPSPASSPCTNAESAGVKYECVPWPTQRPQMFPQSAHQYHPEPLSAEHVEKPSCPFACVSKDGKDIQVQVQETPAGSLLFGVGVNSDSGFEGSVALNERNVETARAEPAPTPAPAPCGARCCAVARTPRPQRTMEEQLIKLIVSTIQPQSWSEMGGSGTIDYFPLGMALVINQTPQIQEQVADLLESLRRLQDEEVAVEVRFVTVPAPFYGQVVNDLGLKLIKCQKECGGQCPAACSKACCKDSPGEGLAFLNASQVAKFYDKIQADPHTDVMQSPKMTMFNGQESTINIMDTQFFVTSMDFRWIGDQVVCFPVNEPVSTGLKMTIQPVVSADKRYVRLSWDASYTEVAMPVPLCPITSEITPTFEGGAKGQPVPFTMFIQQPSLLTRGINKAVCVPNGGTVLLPAWTTCREVPEEVETPILSRIPYVNELFKKVGKHEETTTTVMLVTPRIICNSERETAKVADSEMGPTVIDNLQKLEQAQRLFKKAEQCRRQGQHKVATDCYHQIQHLCPGSRLAHLADRRCRQLDKEERAPEGGYPNLGGVPAPSAVYLVPPPPAPATSPPAVPIPSVVYPPMPALVPVAGSEAVLVPHKVRLEQEAAEMLRKYYQACSEGKWAEATQCAIQALAIDPACFCKEKDMKVFMGQSIPKLAPTP